MLGRVLISRQELLNAVLERRHAAPGVGVEDFEPGWRARPMQPAPDVSPAATPPPGAVRARRDYVTVEAWVDGGHYRVREQVPLHLRLTFSDGFHAFVAPVPDGFTPLTLSVAAPDGVDLRFPAVPGGEPLPVPGLDETFHVVSGRVDLTAQLMVRKSLGELALPIRVSLQACNDRLCYPPETLELTVTAAGVDVIPD